MKKKSFVLFLALLATASNWAFAQLPSADSIDVLHYNLTIDLGATVQKQMRGVADIQFVLTKPCNAVSFDLICDTVRPVSLDGTVTRGFSYDPDGRLLRVYVSGGQPGDTHTLSVPYVSNGYVEHYGWGGLHMDNNIYYNLGVAFREYPHAFGRAWFPCRDNMYDKASYTITVTSQPGWRAICSGIRQSETTASDGTNSSTWTINQPTPTYLVSISSAPWQVIEREYQGEYGTYPAIIGSIVVHDSATVRHAFDILDDVVPAYERTFGPYRWERIGYITTPMGSMEHVSNIGLVAECAASTDSPCQMTMCHELGHAWFGNLVTCTTVGDMWINEGGASFCEEVAAAAAYGKAWADDYYQKNLVNVLLNAHLSDDGYRALSGMPERITYGTTTYKKGALVWHSLRGLMGDSLFTASMHRLFSTYSFGNIDAAGLRDSLRSSPPALSTSRSISVSMATTITSPFASTSRAPTAILAPPACLSPSFPPTAPCATKSGSPSPVPLASLAFHFLSRHHLPLSISTTTFPMPAPTTPHSLLAKALSTCPTPSAR